MHIPPGAKPGRSAGVLLYRFTSASGPTASPGRPAEATDTPAANPSGPPTSGAAGAGRSSRGGPGVRGAGEQSPARSVLGRLEVYLVHPGGPYFRNKDFWGIPKGLIEDGEDEETAARREFQEETGFAAPQELVDLGTVTTHHGKVIHAYAGAWPQDDDPPPVNSNTCPIQWPPHSGKWIDIPEVDEGRFFNAGVAREKMHGCQGELLDRLAELLAGEAR